MNLLQVTKKYLQKPNFKLIFGGVLATLPLLFFVFPTNIFAATLFKPANNLGLVGYWSFNEGTSTRVGDFSGKGSTGILSTGDTLIPTWVYGKFGKALNFGGTQGYVDVTANSTINNQAAFSQSFWIKLNSNVTQERYILRKANPSSTLGWSLALTTTNNRLYFFRSLLTSPMEVTSADFLVAGAGWQHIVLVWDGSATASNVRIYRNGVLMSHTGDANGSGGITDDSAWGFWIGGDNGGDPSVNMSMDEVRNYNRELSTDEVRALYNSSKVLFINSSQNTRITNGLVGFWSMNGADVDWAKGSAFDRSGNNNTGRLISMSTSSSVTDGKVGQAFKFNGLSSYIEIGSPSTLNLTGEMSAFAWVKPSKDSSGSAILGQASACCFGQFTIDVNAGDETVFIRWGDNTAHAPSYTQIINEWQHIGFVRSGSAGNWTSRFYVNGVLYDTATGIATNPGSQENMEIGWHDNGPTVYPGSIDEVRVYNRSLTPQEIKQLYLMGK